MDALQAENETNGTDATTPELTLADPEMGWVGETLQNVGIPAGYANDLGAAITFAIVLALGYTVGRLVVVPLVARLLERRGVAGDARRPLLRVVRVLLGFVAVSVSFGLAGYGSFLTSLATVAAAATLAVGLALQDLIKNFVAGVFIFTDRPFRVGDWIEWDSYEGVVEDISLRVSRVRTFDNELLTVPNSQLTSTVVKNPVAKNKLRVTFTFGIGYGDDIERATECILEAAADHDAILANPGPAVRVTELADSAVGLTSAIWIRNPSRSAVVRVRSEFVTDVKRRFEAEGIDIPFPQRTLSGAVDLGGPADLAGSVE